MKTRLSLLGCLWLATALAQVPDTLVVEGIPPIPAELMRDAGRYLEFRAAAFNDWHPHRRELLISTRFGDASQLHVVRTPGGARRQLTFFAEPVAGGLFDPQAGKFVVFLQDTGGAEFYQLYRYDFANGDATLLTDGKSRNTGPRWSKNGQWLAYNSTRRNGRDTDLYLMDPRQPSPAAAPRPSANQSPLSQDGAAVFPVAASRQSADQTHDRLLAQVQGGGWSVLDWSPDDTKLLMHESISVNESRLHLCDAKTGAIELLTPKSAEKVSWSAGQFAKDGKSLYVVTDSDSSFLQLGRMELATRQLTWRGFEGYGDVESFDLSPDGEKLAYVRNGCGGSTLCLLETRPGTALAAPDLPCGVISGLKWHANSRDLAFTLSSAQAPADVYSFDTKSGKLERWTESETGGLNPASFVEAELVRVKSFDGLEISGFLYRPDARKFPGPRPVLVNIHGGPESQSRPSFQARNNYYVNELGVALLFPNVRGSAGYGKTFLTLDNGFKREDAVRDIGAFLDWIGRDARLDKERVAVMGGSYGGYMVLACLVHYGDRLRCGLESVGIGNFLTFLKNTQDYRRDLRRAEYGDERDPATAEFLARISPANHADKIKKPLLVAQGLNDPRVPMSESEQMVKAIRSHGGQVWYLLPKDEGHGFHKKHNVDHLFYSSVLFLKKHLLQ